MEEKSDVVLLGKLLHETGYKRKFKEVSIGRIKLDFLERGCEIHEVKRSRRVEKAHVFQLLYYLYYLKRLGVDVRGILNYPLLKRRVDVDLTDEREKELETILEDISRILSLDKPLEPIRLPICKRCSYYELCWC
jgi:CRISPR-associated exonuclease Cas4